MLKVYTLLVAAFLSACSSAPKEPPLPPPVINSLTIIAPARPSNYVLDQSSVGTFVLGAVVPLLGFAHRAQLESQKESFREAMTARDVSIDKEFTAAIQSELQKLGFKVTLMEPIQRRTNRSVDTSATPAPASLLWRTSPERTATRASDAASDSSPDRSRRRLNFPANDQ
jgi:hypothetical protein